MKKLEKLWGFRTNKLWKKVFAILYYLSCLIFIILSLNDVPEIKANGYDMLIYKISTLLMSSSYLVPIIFISDFKFKEKIPLLKKKKWWSDVFGFIIIFVMMVCLSNFVSLFHSADYQERYEYYNRTEIIYQEQESDKVPDEDKSSLTDKELSDNLEDLTSNEDTSNKDSNENNSASDNSNKNENNTTNNNENNSNDSETSNEVIQKQIIKIHYIDVGQGDSVFIELPNQQTMLIDAGEASKGKIVASYISSKGYSRIDYLIGTHPHTDHIGGLAYIINNFDIGNIYMPKAISNSKTYESLLNTISAKGLKITTARAGVNIINNNNLKVDIIAPNRDSYNDLNNYSAVIKLTYGNNKFLFMGDAETQSENEIITDVSADIIKIGHHGSDTSSGQSFVNKVKAKYVVIMVGNNNRYNHPYQTIIDRWNNIGAKVYRTDLNGNIIATSDGKSLEISVAR